MKRLMIYLMLTLVCQYVYGKDSTLVVFWNLENFFDYTDGGEGESDKEWSSLGSRRWTKTRFYTKCDAIAKTMFWIGEKYGRMPDIIGVAEVENSGVLYKLLSSTLLRKCDYKVVHYDSHDRRGIDVALLYRSSVFRKVSSSVTVPEYDAEKLLTRDILQVCLETAGGERVNVLVNHHPSKYGGSQASESRRDAAMTVMRNLCDSLAVADSGVPVIAMGDFNDTPDGEHFRMLDGVLVNKADSLFRAGQGTIRFEGKWDLIDMFMVSESISEKSSMEILQVPFLMTYEKKYPGLKPLRTYSGPRYIGGVSDHCPVVLKVY
ncbi:MAG: hypothetical protein IKW27_02935 [Bacteroidales bacterium]|nr:hypothetical protein [Bacteroidales bacterium]